MQFLNLISAIISAGITVYGLNWAFGDDSEEGTLIRQINFLKAIQKNNLELEKYEENAQIRDRINALEQKLSLLRKLKK